MLKNFKKCFSKSQVFSLNFFISFTKNQALEVSDFYNFRRRLSNVSLSAEMMQLLDELELRRSRQ